MNPVPDRPNGKHASLITVERFDTGCAASNTHCKEFNPIVSITQAFSEQAAAATCQHMKRRGDSWCSRARDDAEQASGCPEALNFAGTSINLQEYQAMHQPKTRSAPL